MATIREVAAAAGVSRSTVSLVLNDSPLVKAETREKVLAVIQDMNYVPNNNARSLNTKVMNSLGVIFLSEKSDSTLDRFQREPGIYSFGVLNGIAEGLADTDYSMSIEHYSWNESRGVPPKMIRNRRVDGVFIIGNTYDSEFIAMMKQAGIPLCLIGVPLPGTDHDVVLTSPREGIFLGIQYLMGMGHQNICLINCPELFVSHDDRAEAMKDAEQILGLKFDWNLAVNSESNSGQGAYNAIKKLWEAGHRPDSIITANETAAMGVLRYFYEQEIKVPDQVSIIVYGDNPFCSYASPALTSVNTQRTLRGRKAAEVMLERLANPDGPQRFEKINPYLVKRDSVADRRNGIT